MYALVTGYYFVTSRKQAFRLKRRSSNLPNAEYFTDKNEVAMLILKIPPSLPKEGELRKE
jgi:hypothetical protein